ncbi:MAG: hypothetical protein R2809_01965 [Flavobacteriales bacterium]
MKKILFLVIATAILGAGCKAHKKPKCNTCPKWEDKVEVTK